MKTFSVNKNSWHYRLNFKMCETNDKLYKPELVHKFIMSKDNFCSYWSMTLWSMFKLAVSISFILVTAAFLCYILYLFGYALIFNTTDAVIAIIVVLSLIVVVSATILAGVWFENHKSEKIDKILNKGETETSLAKARYSSWKSGVCVPVEFKE